MKTRRLLGLAALGGGIYWMQKKRGGDMSFASIKESFRGLADDLLNKANLKRADESSTTGTNAGHSRPVAGTGATYGGSAGTYTGSGSAYSGGSGYSGSGSFGGRGGFGGGTGGTRH